MHLSNTVRIVAHTFTLPNGDTKTVEVTKTETSRTRAELYVKYEQAKWELGADGKDVFEAIYFLDPLSVQERIKAKKSGVHGWYVGDCGGSKLVKSLTGRFGRGAVSGGYRVLQTRGGEHSFMDAN